MPTDKIMVWADYPQDFRPAFTLPEHVPDSYEGYLSHLYGLNHGAPPPPVPDTLEPTELFVNAGRWLWQCRVCLAAVPVEPGSPVICYQCGSGGWRMPAFPDNRAELEAELLKQPGHRLSAPLRNWQPGWTLEYLQERTRLAQAAIAGGNPYPRSLSIGSTRAWAGGEVLTAANKNTFESAVMDDLAGRNGPVELEDVLQLFTRTTGERNALTAALGMVLVNSTNNLLEYYNGTNWRAAGFDLHEDIGTELTTLATADRIALSDEGEPGDPNVWASLDTLSSFLHGRISPQLIGSGVRSMCRRPHTSPPKRSQPILRCQRPERMRYGC